MLSKEMYSLLLSPGALLKIPSSFFFPSLCPFPLTFFFSSLHLVGIIEYLLYAKNHARSRDVKVRRTNHCLYESWFWEI